MAHAQTAVDRAVTEDDPAKLFQQGQDAHEAGDLQRAVELYERAIKLHPEFPEAEYQRAVALVSLNRLAEAEKGFRRAMELQPEWSLPQTALGRLLASLDRYDEAEKLLRHALELEANNTAALIALADLYLREKAPREKLQALLAEMQRATERERTGAPLWLARSRVELAIDDKASAAASLDHAIVLDSRNVEALMERARLSASAGHYEMAIADATEARLVSRSPVAPTLLLARIYAQAGKIDAAEKALDSLDEASKQSPEAVALRGSLQKDCANSTAEERAATEELLKKEPGNPSLLSCLGAALRTVDPARSLELYKQASAIEPTSVRYATGYAAALVQARRFAEAVVILRRILSVEPDNTTVRSNLATALYELKQYADAITEFQRLLELKPDATVAYFFIATAHDFLGEYAEALAAYETFLARADAEKNQLEIDKVNLRLPVLRNQLKRGEGVKKKKKS